MRRVAIFLLLGLLCAAPVFVLPACEPEIITPEPDPDPDPEPEPDPDPVVVAGWAELPAMETIEGVEYITHWVSADGMSMAAPTDAGRKRNMTIAFDTGRHVPSWVAYPMHTWYWSPRGTSRTDYWAWDPSIPRDVQPDIVTNGSYWQQAPDGAFSRGHILASADRLRSVPMNRQTFYTTNIAPQTHSGFNDAVWSDLEFKVRDWSGSSTDTLYCVTGVAFEWDKVTYDKRSPRMEIPVPSHFYKVLLQPKTATAKHVSQLSASELRCIGFWFDNVAGARTLASGAMSVADIEKRVGLRFFPMLSDEAASIKQTLDKVAWGIQ